MTAALPVATPAAGTLPRWRTASPILVATVCLGLAALLALAVGKAPISPAQVAELILARAGLAAPDAPANADSILFQIRLPRIVLAGLVGGALAVAGATYQGVFRNPLADPYLLGVASGAGLGAVLAFILPVPRHLHAIGAVQAFAFLGGLAAVIAVYLLGRVGGSVPTTALILAGVAVSAAATALTAYLMYVRGDQLLVIYSWIWVGLTSLAGGKSASSPRSYSSAPS